MCHRVICPDCGKYTWEGCGLHIAQALRGLSLEQICSCDDDVDSEHTLSISSRKNGLSTPVPATTTAGADKWTCNKDKDPSAACQEPPSPVEYKLSKISSAKAAESAFRREQQAEALEELRRAKREKEQALKDSNKNALEKLMQGLAQATKAT
ncbi:hypothetical protein EMPS_09033 [Entomortierella parvispora]|uniref:Uncharacterized protein n=1 Tax=Entomortierella parvispora TaxID=205924 RepID=A0A9P3LZW0_9FUNG|nr:hypothetical protein EMPS_09033 [Entomortierella parvispora]